MLVDDYDESVYSQEDGVAALHVAALLLDAHPNAAKHMVGVGGLALFLSRWGYVVLSCTVYTSCLYTASN